MTQRRRCAVLGSPVAHSLSPVLWRAAYAELDLDWTYDAIECTVDALPERLAAMAVSGEWVAVSLTMPLKLTAVGLVDELDAAAAAAGAVNTVLFGDDGVLRGLNTDVPGLSACLGEAGAVVDDRAAPVVLGGGGTARAAIVALGRAGADVVRVLVRDPDRSTGLLTVGARSGCEVRPEPWPESLARLGEPSVVVQTTPAGAADSLAGTGWPAGVPLIEALYAPWPTALAAAAGEEGAPVIGGLRLLAHQAGVAVEAAAGLAVPVNVLAGAAGQV